MSAAGEFVDATLQHEGTWERAAADEARHGTSLSFYGASMGAVRGTVRDALRRYPGLSHDDITALSSELWVVPVFERRLAATVLLQTNVDSLLRTDLTRVEGFVRDARIADLVDQLATDVVRPLLERLTGQDLTRATTIIDRWAAAGLGAEGHDERDGDALLRRAAAIIRAPFAG